MGPRSHNLDYGLTNRSISNRGNIHHVVLQWVQGRITLIMVPDAVLNFVAQGHSGASMGPRSHNLDRISHVRLKLQSPIV